MTPLFCLFALQAMVTVAVGQDQPASSPSIYYEHFTTSPAVQSTGGAIYPASSQLPDQPPQTYPGGNPPYDSESEFEPVPEFPEPRGPAIEPPPGYLEQDPRTFYENVPPDQVFSDGAAGPPLRFIRGRVKATWLPAESDEIGITELDMRGSVIFSRWPLLTVTPGFQIHMLDGPTRTDLPGQLYGTQLELRLARPPNMTTPWGYELAVAPGYYSDFENNESDALRITGRGVFYLAQSIALQWVLGVAYLDREDVALLPIAGVIYAPRDDLRMELIFPKPRIARRIRQRPNSEQWVYLAGEFGGGSWAIERANGRNDVVTIRDLRISLGLETKHADGRSLFVEAGLVFDRELEYKSEIGDFEPNATGMLRLGVIF